MTQPQLERLTCTVHPDRETLLRCNRCNRPMCSECAVLTPTGYRCRECVRGQQKVFETTATRDLMVGVIIALVISFAGSYIARVMQFFTFFIAPIVGLLIVEVIRWAVKRRRSRLLAQLSAGAAFVGALPLLGMVLINLVLVLTGNSLTSTTGYLLAALWQVVYAGLVTSTVYRRLSGIQL
jgi:hypothetical protein